MEQNSGRILLTHLTLTILISQVSESYLALMVEKIQSLSNQLLTLRNISTKRKVNYTLITYMVLLTIRMPVSYQEEVSMTRRVFHLNLLVSLVDLLLIPQMAEYILLIVKVWAILPAKVLQHFILKRPKDNNLLTRMKILKQIQQLLYRMLLIQQRLFLLQMLIMLVMVLIPHLMLSHKVLKLCLVSLVLLEVFHLSL